MPSPKNAERKANYERFARVWWLLRIEARELRGVSRKKLAAAIGYPPDQAGFITDIDRGNRIPEPATLDKLTTCMGLAYEDKSLLFDLAGYLFSRQVPDLESIKQELTPLAERHRHSRYPVMITDRRFAFWVLNPAGTELFGSFEGQKPTDTIKALVNYYHNQPDARFITIFDVVFNSGLPFRSRLMNADSFCRYQIARFKSLNRGEQHRRFYVEYPERMEKWLSPEDYAFFKRIWNETEAAFEGKGNIHVRATGTGTGVRADLVTIPIHGLDGFFEITYLEPETDEIENILNAHKFFPSRSDTEDSYLAVWDSVPAKDLLAHYTQEYSEPWRTKEIVDRLAKRLQKAGIEIEKERKEAGRKTDSSSELQS